MEPTSPHLQNAREAQRIGLGSTLLDALVHLKYFVHCDNINYLVLTFRRIPKFTNLHNIQSSKGAGPARYAPQTYHVSHPAAVGIIAFGDLGDWINTNSRELATTFLRKLHLTLIRQRNSYLSRIPPKKQLHTDQIVSTCRVNHTNPFC